MPLEDGWWRAFCGGLSSRCCFEVLHRLALLVVTLVGSVSLCVGENSLLEALSLALLRLLLVFIVLDLRFADLLGDEVFLPLLLDIFGFLFLIFELGGFFQEYG